MLVLGILSRVEALAGGEHEVNLTIIDEAAARFFNSGGGRCWSRVHEVVPLDVGPDEAYRFAKGETVISSTGLKARLARPLDFLVVADHAENLGLAPLLMARDPALMATDFGKALRAKVDAGDLSGAWEIWSKSKATGKDPLAGREDIYRTAYGHVSPRLPSSTTSQIIA